MIAILLIVIAAILAIVLVVVAYSANQRKRAGQSGAETVRDQQNMPRPRASGEN